MQVKSSFFPLVRLLCAVSAIVAATACDGTPTEPSARSPRIPSIGRFDDTQGDTLLCRSGYVVIDGRYSCGTG
jgi:hypothetical protein